MGAEALCSARIGRKTSSGKALLESNELIFRGDGVRVAIPLVQITSAEAAGGKLKIAYPGGAAIFDLGPKAAAWAEKIRNPKSLIDKLDLKAAHRVAVLRVRDAAFVEQVRQRVAHVSPRLANDVDVIFFRAEKLADLDRLPDLVTRIKRDGAIWTITPKGKGGIKDTDIMAIAKTAGLVALKVVSFSETHSTNKFVIPKAQR